MLKFIIGFIVGLVVAISTALASSLPTDVTFAAVITASCEDVTNQISDINSKAPGEINQLTPVGYLLNSLNYKRNPIGGFDLPIDVRSNMQVGVLVEPNHGKVTRVEGTNIYIYEGNKDTHGQPYLGRDTVVFWVQIEGKYYKVVQNLWVGTGDGGHGDVCESIKYPPITFNITPLDNSALAQTANIVSPSFYMVSLKPEFQCQ